MRSVSGEQGKFAIARQRAALPNRWAQFIDCGDHYWNTVHLGHAVTERRNEGWMFPLNFFPISPLGWAHILLTGEYLWPKEPKAGCHFALSRNRPQLKDVREKMADLARMEAVLSELVCACHARKGNVSPADCVTARRNEARCIGAGSHGVTTP
jgi:hypothetical protein